MGVLREEEGNIYYKNENSGISALILKGLGACDFTKDQRNQQNSKYQKLVILKTLNNFVMNSEELPYPPHPFHF